jgi:glucose uptake protein GlcU
VYYGTHRRKLRRLQKKGMSYLLLAICFEAMLPSIYKMTLIHLSPFYIALLRCLTVLVLSSLFFRPKNMHKLSSQKLSYGFLAGVVYALGAVTSLYAIRELGVVLTMLLTLLGPFLRYLSGYFILKENVRTGEMVSSFLLALVVLVPIIK